MRTAERVARTVAAAVAAMAGAMLPLARATESSVLELPHARADRAAREVRIEARATGIEGRTQAEFFLIATNSGHDYEAVAVSLARPSDVHRALEFIGLQPGRPIDPKALRFWPRGERVIAEFEWREGGETSGPPRRTRMEETLLDLRTGRPLPADGLVFVGSARVPAPDGTGTVVYAADEIEPHSIASAFNLETTVLDIPRRGSQSALYDYQIVNPDLVWTAATPLTVVLRPEPRPAGDSRIVDLDLTVRPAADGSTSDPFLTRLTRQPDGTAVADGTPSAVQAAIESTAARDHDVHLTIRLNDTLALSHLRAVGEWLAAVAEHPNVRVEPPPQGQLYYRALAPDPALRDRAERPSQPWELRLQPSQKDGGWKAVLSRVEPGRDILTDAPTFVSMDFEADTPAALRARLDEHGPGLRVIVVYAPGRMSFGDMMKFVAPLTATHPVIHVFAD